MPLPSSETETATCTPSRAAETRMGTDSGECLAALERRLSKTWKMSGRSAITRGRSGERSMKISCLPPPVRNVFLACSTRPANSAGSGGHRQRAGVDTTHNQQVPDQTAHVVGLLVDELEELGHLGWAYHRRRAEHGGGRALDGGERDAQLVADHGQKLCPATAPAPPAASDPATSRSLASLRRGSSTPYPCGLKYLCLETQHLSVQLYRTICENEI